MQTPKLFVSYSWTSPDHEAWVLQLATDLRDSGVDVVLDKWDLREGDDAYSFMERMVADADITKVMLVCDRAYAAKADGRSGGVGTEAQIVSPEIYAKASQSKFVAVVVERDGEGKAYLPTYYKSRIYIDFSDASKFAESFDQLLRWAYEKPLHIKPELGKPPGFLESGHVSLGTAAKARRAIDAVREGRTNRHGAVIEYFATFAENLEKINFSPGEVASYDKLVERIEAFSPHRNELLELLFAIARYQDDYGPELHQFFESILPYYDRTKSGCEIFRFVGHEVFLYTVAILLKYERFGCVESLLATPYYFAAHSRSEDGGVVTFAELREHIPLIEGQNDKLNRRISLHSELLEKRSHESGVSFVQLMQADFVLFVRDCLDCLANEDKQQGWYPLTLVYAERQPHPFEMFARAQSKTYFNRISPLLGVSAKDDFLPLFKAFFGQVLRIPRWGFTSFNPRSLLGYDEIATRP